MVVFHWCISWCYRFLRGGYNSTFTNRTGKRRRIYRQQKQRSWWSWYRTQVPWIKGLEVIFIILLL